MPARVVCVAVSSTRARALIRMLPMVLLGAAATPVLLLAGIHIGLVLVVAGAAYILLLPRYPRSVAAFALGLVVTFGIFAVVWTSGWGCASEVDGVLVEHDCGGPPYRG